MSRLVGEISEEQKTRLKAVADNPKNKKRLKSQKLDKDAFLKLMLEQLKNQNPLDPMDNKDFMAQMAQFSSVEQLSNMVQSQEKMNKMAESLSKKIDGIKDVLQKSIEKDNKNLEKNEKFGKEALETLNKIGKENSEKLLKELQSIKDVLSAYVTNNNNDKDAVAKRMEETLGG